MRSRKSSFYRVLKTGGSVLIILGVADAAELLEKDTLIEVLVVPYIWILGAIMLVVSFALEHKHRRVYRKSKKDLEIELEGLRHKRF